MLGWNRHLYAFIIIPLCVSNRWLMLSEAAHFTIRHLFSVTWLFLVGMVVFLLMSLVKTPPSVSMPSDSGVTSSSSTSVTSPARTPPWMAAPMATASSGFTDLLGARPNRSWTVCWTWGRTRAAAQHNICMHSGMLRIMIIRWYLAERVIALTCCGLLKFLIMHVLLHPQ